jgi:hypothetical protein
MEEGYKFIAEEQKRFTSMVSETEHEVIPDWE